MGFKFKAATNRGCGNLEHSDQPQIEGAEISSIRTSHKSRVPPVSILETGESTNLKFQFFVSVLHRRLRPAMDETLGCPIHRASFARWVGDHEARVGTVRFCFVSGHRFTDAKEKFGFQGF